MTAPGAMLEYIATRDHRLMRRLNRWHAPRWVRLWMLTATRGGDGWLWCALGAAVLLWGGAERYRTFVAALVACAAGVVIFLRIKPKARRVRPCAIEPHCWARLLPPDQFSFPSGHTITAFAAVVSIGCVYPLLVPVLAFCALSVAASRIVLGMHFLSDVVAGAAIGTGLGYAAHAISLIAA